MLEKNSIPQDGITISTILPSNIGQLDQQENAEFLLEEFLLSD